MNDSEQKAAFEAWATQQTYCHLDVEKYAFDCVLGLEGEYRCSETDVAWFAWRAAIEWSQKNVCNRN